MICRMIFRRIFSLCVLLVFAIPLLGGSTVTLSNQVERVRAYTRDIEFDYVEWILDALGTKLEQQALGVIRYLPEETRRQTTLEYLKLIQQIQQSEASLSDIYADPDITDPNSASASLRQELDELYARRARLAPLAESVLQEQVSAIVEEMGLSLAGQPVPPVFRMASTDRKISALTCLPELTSAGEAVLPIKSVLL
jgi:hypothetical protein